MIPKFWPLQSLAVTYVILDHVIALTESLFAYI